MPSSSPYPSYAKEFDEAVAEFWRIRGDQGSKQISSGQADAGTRGNVTGGKHLGPLEQLIVSIFEANGFSRSCISTGNSAQLPGYYREQKNWDIVVRHGDSIVATIELKSQSKSFGNNLNNRIEEAIGQTVDFWAATEHGLIPGMRPWFGYVMIVEDDPRSRRQVRGGSGQSLLPTDPVFTEASYIERYALAFERMVLERQLDAVCYATTVKDSRGASFPTQAMSFNYFAGQVSDRCRAVISALGEPPTDN